MGLYPTKLGSTGSGASNVLTAAEIDVLDGVTPGTTTASKVVTTGATNKVVSLDLTELKIGGTAVGSTAAQIDAAVAGTPLVYRTTVTAALVNAGATAVVPAVAGKRFQVLSIQMRANGGNVSGPTTVGVKEDGGAIFLSHAIADLTATVWHNLVTGTAVITGMTSGGMTAVANKGLLAYCAGGDSTVATAASIDYIVCGYYTTT